MVEAISKSNFLIRTSQPSSFKRLLLLLLLGLGQFKRSRPRIQKFRGIDLTISITNFESTWPFFFGDHMNRLHHFNTKKYTKHLKKFLCSDSNIWHWCKISFWTVSAYSHSPIVITSKPHISIDLSVLKNKSERTWSFWNHKIWIDLVVLWGKKIIIRIDLTVLKKCNLNRLGCFFWKTEST